MRLSPELEALLEDVPVGSSQYHYVIADYLTKMSNEEIDLVEKQGLAERAAFHKSIGDGFSGK
jgi:hypothetical protein